MLQCIFLFLLLFLNCLPPEIGHVTCKFSLNDVSDNFNKSFSIDKFLFIIPFIPLIVCNKKYNGDDITNTGQVDKIVEAINRLRNPVKMMNSDEQQKVMKYMQNLKKLSTLFHHL